MDAKTLARYKKLLEEKRQEILAARKEDEAPAPGSGHVKGDLVDQATVETEAKLRIKLRETESHLMRAIEDALARVEQKTFGTCQVCKNPIGEARLNAVPWTRQCLACKEQEHS